MCSRLRTRCAHRRCHPLTAAADSAGINDRAATGASPQVWSCGGERPALWEPRAPGMQPSFGLPWIPGAALLDAILRRLTARLTAQLTTALATVRKTADSASPARLRVRRVAAGSARFRGGRRQGAPWEESLRPGQCDQASRERRGWATTAASRRGQRSCCRSGRQAKHRGSRVAASASQRTRAARASVRPRRPRPGHERRPVDAANWPFAP
jgi:hypothetical protein